MKSNAFGIVAVVLLFALAAGFTVHFGLTRELPLLPGDPRFTPIVRAIESGDTAKVSSILDQDKNLLNEHWGDESLLHVAARMNQPEVIELLLARGADLNARGQFNGSVLHWACWFGSVKAAELLVEKGLDVEDKNDVFGSTPLLWAAHGSSNIASPDGDYIATVRLLVSKGAKADTRNAEGIPAISIASEAVAEELEKHGASQPIARPAAGDLIM